MPKERNFWLRERLFPDIAQLILARNILGKKIIRGVDGKRHEFLIAETPRFGSVTTLDGVVQSASAFRYYYDEVLVHCAANSCLKPPRRALVVGYCPTILSEMRRHKSLRHIEVVETDKRIVEMVRRCSPPDMIREERKGERVHVMIIDPRQYAARARKKGVRYDLVIIDSPDPMGSYRLYFETSFYMDLAAILRKGGVLIRQTGSAAFQPDIMPANYFQLQSAFPQGSVQTFITSVPAYVGGYFTLVAASHTKGIFEKAHGWLEKRMEGIERREALQWYSPDMHRSAMALPPALSRTIAQAEFGKQLLIDMKGCDYARMESPQLRKEFVRKICKVIKMKPFKSPQVYVFGHGQPRTKGTSVLQLIHTSHIVFHGVPIWRVEIGDIFTCAELDVKAAVEFTINFFRAESATGLVVPRGQPFDEPPAILEGFKVVRTRNGFFTTAYHYERSAT